MPKQKGGALNHVPKPSRDLQVVPSKVNNGADLQKYMQFYSIIGHGSIPPRDKGTLFLVPERTYILFIARAGEPTDKIKPVTDAILDAFRYKKLDSSKPGGVEDEKAWYERTFTSMEDGSLFRDLLYDLSKEDNSKRVSIYQPGDLVQNLEFTLENTSPPWDPVGVWKLPLEPSTATKLDRARANFNRLRDELYNGEAKSVVDAINNWFNEKQSFLVAEGIEAGENEGQIALEQMLLENMQRYLLYSYKLPHSELKALDSLLRPEGGPNIIEMFLRAPENRLLSELLRQLQEKIFILAQRNMVNQQEFDNEPNNLVRSLQQTRLFTTENPRSTTVYEFLQNRPSLGFSNYTMKNSFPIYRFFLFDICRSLQERPYPVAKRLVRTLSNVMRFNSTPTINESVSLPRFNTLLNLTKKEFEKMLATTPPSRDKNPTLTTLLAGGQITYKELEQLFGSVEDYEGAFEEFVKYHRFDKGDKAIVKFRVPQTIAKIAALENKEVIINSFQSIAPKAVSGSAFYYNIKETADGEVLPVPARNLWKSAEDYAEVTATRETIKTEKTILNEAYAKAAQERNEQAEFNSVMVSSEIPYDIPRLKYRQEVKISGIKEPGPVELNDTKGFIIGATIKMTKSGNILVYTILMSTGPNTGEEKRFPYFNVVSLSSGGRHKSKTYKKRQNKKTRQASK